MQSLTVTACVAALLVLASCGNNATERAATGGLGGATAGLVVAGPVGAVAGAAGGAAVGASTARK